MDRRPNALLKTLLAEAGWSHAGLAKRVNDGCKAQGSNRSYTATSVANWLSGMTPADPVPELLAALLTQRLGRSVSRADLGYTQDVALDRGLVWPSTTPAAVSTVAELWRADMQRRAVLVKSAWIAAALTTPTREWLLDWADESVSHRGGRRVGTAEVDVVWSLSQAFADADHRLGGGYARTTLVHYVNEVVLPLLGGTYPDKIGRLLTGATARLCDLAGFMAFDSDAQGLGQRHYIQALRLAQASGDRALGAHILTDMAMQAHYLGNGAEACTLARAGQRAATQAGSYASLARCCAMEARAHARLGDHRQCAQAMRRAEAALNQAQADDEPVWIRFFTTTQLHAEFTYAAAELGRAADVQSFAAPVLSASSEMDRRHVLVTATKAGSHLMAGRPGGGRVDVEQACTTLAQTMPFLPTLTTARALAAVNTVRRQLASYSTQEPVRELEAALEPLIGAAT